MNETDWETFANTFFSSSMSSYTITHPNLKQPTTPESFDASVGSSLSPIDHDAWGTPMYKISSHDTPHSSYTSSPSSATGVTNLFDVDELSGSGGEEYHYGTSPFSSGRELDRGVSPRALFAAEDSQLRDNVMKGSSESLIPAIDLPMKSIPSSSHTPSFASGSSPGRIDAGATGSVDSGPLKEPTSSIHATPSAAHDSLPRQAGIGAIDALESVNGSIASIFRDRIPEESDFSFMGDPTHVKATREDARIVKDGPLTQQELRMILSVHEVQSATVVNGAEASFMLFLEVKRPVCRDGRTNEKVAFIGFPSESLMKTLLARGPRKDKGLFICKCGRSYTKNSNWSRHVRKGHGPTY